MPTDEADKQILGLFAFFTDVRVQWALHVSAKRTVGLLTPQQAGPVESVATENRHQRRFFFITFLTQVRAREDQVTRLGCLHSHDKATRQPLLLRRSSKFPFLVLQLFQADGAVLLVFAAKKHLWILELGIYSFLSFDFAEALASLFANRLVSWRFQSHSLI